MAEVMSGHCCWEWVIEPCSFRVHPGSQSRMQDGEYEAHQAYYYQPEHPSPSPDDQVQEPEAVVEFSKQITNSRPEPDSEAAAHYFCCALRGCVSFALLASVTSKNSHGLDIKTTPLVHDDRLLNGEACLRAKA